MSSGSLVLGLINGMLIGFLAVGVVLVYKSNRFLNLAHAQLGALSVQLLGKLVLDDGWNWWVAFAVTVPVGMAVGGIVDHFLVRPLRARSASTVTLLLVSLGISQLLLVFTYIPKFGPSTTKLYEKGFPQPFNSTLHIGEVVLSGSDVLIMVLVPILIAALAVLLRFSTLGKSIRAAASNPQAARLAGISTNRVSVITWALAGGVSAVTAILEAPSQTLFDAAALGPYLLFLGLGAAALGAFVSIPLALVGGLAIGVVDQLVLAGTSDSGTGELAVFVTIVAIVLVRGKAIGRVFASGGALTEDRPPLRIPAALRTSPTVLLQRKVPVAAALGLALLLPLLPVLRPESRRFDLVLIAMYALVAVSLTVAIGWAGQVSLGQFALVGVGAFVAGHLLAHGMSLVILVLITGLVAAVVTTLIGLPALRVPGLTFAVTTLGFAVIAPDWLFHQTWLGTASSEGLDISKVPTLLPGIGRPSGELTVYYFSLVVAVVLTGGLWALRRTGPGRLVVAVRDNEAAAASFGITPGATKVAALAVSGFAAGTAGVMWADAWRVVTPSQFTPDVSISLIALPVIGGLGSVGGAIAAAVIEYAFAFVVAPHLGALFGSTTASTAAVLLIGGLGLVLVVHRAPQGIAGGVQNFWQRRLDRMAEEADGGLLPDGPVEAGRGASLRVQDVHLRFGGLKVLNGTTIEVRPGEIVGLIGPNGAGKTTLLNTISGRLPVSQGRICIGTHDVTGMDPELRAAYGLGRSFQDAHLFPGLTVVETVQVAINNRYKVGVMSSMVGAPWVRSTEKASRREAQEVVDRLGLSAYAGSLTSQLSTGSRRICDLAAQLAARPEVLLLDEPTAGVAQKEAEAFGPLLRRIRDELDCSILIVEHDMPLLMGLCDRIYAMVLGQVIAEGTPEEIRANPAVIASYLGTDEIAITRSGRRHEPSHALPAPPPAVAAKPKVSAATGGLATRTRTRGASATTKGTAVRRATAAKTTTTTTKLTPKAAAAPRPALRAAARSDEPATTGSRPTEGLATEVLDDER